MLKESSTNNLLVNHFLKGLLLVTTLINKHASKFLTLYLFHIFIYLYNGSILERLAKSKKVNE